MPKPLGNWSYIYNSKGLRSRFIRAYDKTSTIELMKQFKLSYYDYRLLRAKLNLRSKKIYKDKHGIAKFFEWQPIDHTIMDFSKIFNYCQRLGI